MNIVDCPLYDAAFYTYTIDLSGDTFSLTFRWNERAGQWLMEIDDAEGNKLARGIALVPFYPLVRQLSLPSPSGEFLLVSYDTTSPQILNPREIYKTHYLFYVSEGGS